MSLSLLQSVALLADPRVVGPPLRVLRALRARGVRRLPPEVFDMGSGRLRARALRAFLRDWLDGERLTRHRGQWVLNSFLPPFPGPAYERLFTNLLSGRHLSPVSAFLAITAQCPYRCSHCSRNERRVPGGELTTDEWRGAIAQLHALGVSVVGFTGGEPCLRADLVELVRVAAEGGASTIVFTSGAGFDEPLARRLRAVGLWSVCVSLDADTVEAHEAHRGAGTFGTAVAALRLARRLDFYTMAGSLATPEAVRAGMPARLHAFLCGLGVHELRIVEAMPCGRLTGCEAGRLLAEEDVQALRCFHLAANRSGRGPKVCAFNRIESPDVFGCGAGTQHLYVEPSGVVCPCDFTPLGFGNVRQEPLAAIWGRMNEAMGGMPRAHCFVQRHRGLIAARAAEGYPLPTASSEAVCREAGRDGLPAFFSLMGAGREGRR